MIGAISDDFTGATDVALAFRARGLRTRLYFGAPTHPPAPRAADTADAVVVALKSRVAPRRDAVDQSLAALRWLRALGADHIYFKYCSTFDSTPEGNIGPVLDALADELGVPTVITTPSSPEHRRTQYQGYLFVDGLLLSESHMATHPVNPMTESSLRKLLGTQTRHGVGLIAWDAVREGPRAVRARAAEQAALGYRYLFVDAVSEQDLLTIGRAVVDDPLVSGAAGLAGALAAAVQASRPDGTLDDPGIYALPDTVVRGPVAILSGSCSVHTLGQVAELVAREHPLYQLDPLRDSDPVSLADAALAWYDSVRGGNRRAPVFSSSLHAAGLELVRASLGVTRPAALLEAASGRIAAGLRARGFTRLVVAGGETAGAVVTALELSSGQLGPEVAAGVPWILNADADFAMLLKSGNFGPPGLLADLAADAVPEPAAPRPRQEPAPAPAGPQRAAP